MGSDLKAFGQRLRSRRNELNISQLRFLIANTSFCSAR